MKPVVKSVYLNICLISFPIHNSPKQGDALSPLLFNFGLEYTVRNVQEKRVGLQFNGIRQLMVYADGVKLWKGKMNAVKSNTEDINGEILVEVNAEKSVWSCLITRMHNKIVR
jgi:hypothetical protein